MCQIMAINGFGRSHILVHKPDTRTQTHSHMHTSTTHRAVVFQELQNVHACHGRVSTDHSEGAARRGEMGKQAHIVCGKVGGKYLHDELHAVHEFA